MAKHKRANNALQQKKQISYHMTLSHLRRHKKMAEIYYGVHITVYTLKASLATFLLAQISY